MAHSEESFSQSFRLEKNPEPIMEELLEAEFNRMVRGLHEELKSEEIIGNDDQSKLENAHEFYRRSGGVIHLERIADALEELVDHFVRLREDYRENNPNPDYEDFD